MQKWEMLSVELHTEHLIVWWPKETLEMAWLAAKS
jgi:hypothetical protein